MLPKLKQRKNKNYLRKKIKNNIYERATTMMPPRDPFRGKNLTWWVNDPLRSISKSAEQANKSRKIASLQITAHIFWRFPNGKELTIWFSNRNFRFSLCKCQYPTSSITWPSAATLESLLAPCLTWLFLQEKALFWTCWTIKKRLISAV